LFNIVQYQNTRGISIIQLALCSVGRTLMSIKLWNYKTHITWVMAKANATNVLYSRPTFHTSACTDPDPVFLQKEK